MPTYKREVNNFGTERKSFPFALSERLIARLEITDRPREVGRTNTLTDVTSCTELSGSTCKETKACFADICRREKSAIDEHLLCVADARELELLRGHRRKCLAIALRQKNKGTRFEIGTYEISVFHRPVQIEERTGGQVGKLLDRRGRSRPLRKRPQLEIFSARAYQIRHRSRDRREFLDGE
jgi:hypothetical protein